MKQMYSNWFHTTPGLEVDLSICFSDIWSYVKRCSRRITVNPYRWWHSPFAMPGHIFITLSSPHFVAFFLQPMIFCMACDSQVVKTQLVAFKSATKYTIYLATSGVLVKNKCGAHQIRQQVHSPKVHKRQQYGEAQKMCENISHNYLFPAKIRHCNGLEKTISRISNCIHVGI